MLAEHSTAVRPGVWVAQVPACPQHHLQGVRLSAKGGNPAWAAPPGNRFAVRASVWEGTGQSRQNQGTIWSGYDLIRVRFDQGTIWSGYDLQVALTPAAVSFWLVKKPCWVCVIMGACQSGCDLSHYCCWLCPFQLVMDICNVYTCKALRLQSSSGTGLCIQGSHFSGISKVKSRFREKWSPVSGKKTYNDTCM